MLNRKMEREKKKKLTKIKLFDSQASGIKKQTKFYKPPMLSSPPIKEFLSGGMRELQKDAVLR